LNRKGIFSISMFTKSALNQKKFPLPLYLTQGCSCLFRDPWRNPI
jgi:hypothetical protein